MVLRNRPRVRKVRRARRGARRLRVRRDALGGFTIARRYDPIYVANTIVNGAFINTNPTIIAVGTPEMVTAFGNDIYNVPFAMRFDLKTLSQYTDLTAICDRYKILGATIKISYNSNTAWGSAAGLTGQGYAQAACMPLVNYIQDYDDDAVLDCTSVRAKMGLKQRVFKGGNSQVVIKVAPRPAPNVFNGDAAAYAVPSRSQWINAGYTSVPHYGIKGYLQNVPLGSVQQYASAFTFDITLRVACKDLQ